MKRLLAFGTIALTLAACSPNQKTETSPTLTKPSIQEVFKSSETLNGTALKYPAGNPELRLCRVEIPSVGNIHPHTNPAPMMVYVPGVMLTKEKVRGFLRAMDGEEEFDDIELDATALTSIAGGGHRGGC